MNKVYARYGSAVLIAACLLTQNLCSAALAKGAASAPASATAAKSGDAKPAKKTIDVKITDLAPVKVGDTAKISVKTEPSAMCRITVKLKSGPSTSNSLAAQRADDKGVATWNWKVGKNTEPGDWPVTVECSLKGAKGSDSGTIKIQK